MNIYKEPLYFLDTNIWIAYFINRKVATLLEKLRNDSYITCTELMDEIKDVVFRERITKKIPAELFDNYRQYIEVQLFNIMKRANIHISTPVPISHQLPAADPKDWYIYNLAQLHPVIIVTGDAHLLAEPGLNCMEPAVFFKGR